MVGTAPGVGRLNRRRVTGERLRAGGLLRDCARRGLRDGPVPGRTLLRLPGPTAAGALRGGRFRRDREPRHPHDRLGRPRRPSTPGRGYRTAPSASTVETLTTHPRAGVPNGPERLDRRDAHNPPPGGGTERPRAPRPSRRSQPTPGGHNRGSKASTAPPGAKQRRVADYSLRWLHAPQYPLELRPAPHLGQLPEPKRFRRSRGLTILVPVSLMSPPSHIGRVSGGKRCGGVQQETPDCSGVPRGVNLGCNPTGGGHPTTGGRPGAAPAGRCGGRRPQCPSGRAQVTPRPPPGAPPSQRTSP